MGENFLKVSAIIFDLGGVYFSDGTKKVIELICEKYSVEKPILKNIYYGDRSWDLRINKISSSDYWDSIYKQYPDLNHIDFKTLWYDSFVINHQMADLIRILAKTYCLGIISGNIADRVDYLERKYSFSHIFDFKIYSFNTGLHKIDKRLYDIASSQLSALGIHPEETIFIDDNEDCLEAAMKVGMQTILFKNDFSNLCLNFASLGVKTPHMPNDKSEFSPLNYGHLKIMEFTHWDLYLSDNKNYLGRMYLVAKNGDGRDFSDLNREEINEFHELSKKIKKVLYALFQPDLINYASLCNVYKKLHVHFVPRYKNKRYFYGVEFTDKRWGMNYSPYDHNYIMEIDCLLAVKNSIISMFCTA